MRVVWITDPHLNFCSQAQISRFSDAVRAENPDVILLGGDIGEAPSVWNYLKRLVVLWDRPIYFVLGNHDYYGSSIHTVREHISRDTAILNKVIWLNSVNVVPLTDHWALVGHDSWADGQLGDYAGSTVQLNDFSHIAEFKGLSKPERQKLLSRLGAEAANHFRRVLPQAFATHKRVLLLTHVPPFREAAWHNGKPSEPHWLPYFANKVVGEQLTHIMRKYPDRHLTVLCGHTHGKGKVSVLPNLLVHTGGTEYGHPKIQKVLKIV